MPPPRSAAALTAVVLGMGVMIGAALGPAAVGSPQAAQRAVLVLAPTATPAAALVAPPSLGAPDGVDAAPVASSPAPADTGGGAASGGDTTTATTPTTTTTTPATTTTPTTPTPAPAADSTLLAGTVVHVDDQAGGYVLADADGKLLAVHDSAPPKLGATVQAHARKLANGTWSDNSFEQGAAPATTATLAGVVTAVDSGRGAYVVSARGVSLVVDVPGAGATAAPASPATPGCSAPPAGPAAADTSTTPTTTTTTTTTSTTTPTTPTTTTPAAPPPLPPVGTHVKADVRIVAAAKGAPARLEQVTRTDAPLTPKPLELEGIVCAVDATARTVTLTSDDLGELGATLTLHAGAAFKLDQIPPQSEIAATATPRPDGSFDLTGVSADGGAVAADDKAYVQGDQRGG